MIKTANRAGGGVKNHRTIEAAARRVVYGDDVYGGYVVVEITGSHDEQELRERIEELRKSDA